MVLLTVYYSNSMLGGRRRLSAFAAYKKAVAEEKSVSELQPEDDLINEEGINGGDQLEVAGKLQKPNESSGIEPDSSKSELLSKGEVLPASSNAKKKRRRKRRRDGVVKKDDTPPIKKQRKNESVVDVIANGTCGVYNESSSDLVSSRVSSTSNGDHDTSFFHTFNPNGRSDSHDAAVDLFKLLISPLSPEKFFREYWEKKPTVLHRHKHHYNDGWFSTEELDTILREQYLEFSTNVDLTTYVDGVRKTHNPTGRARANTVWEHFKEGCSVRLLNPQTYSKTIWLLNSTLQELFSSCMGANVYLTPAGSQGFSPHYDDIEAFVMQLEGRKRWRLYQPRNDYEVLPRLSSPNFTDADIGDPIMEVVLEAGDLLYFPRGTIHQAETLSDSHSLHITLSTFQKHSWADFLEKLLPAALEVAAAEDRDFRAGLPVNYLSYTGIVNSDSNDQRREAFFKKISLLFGKLCKYAPVDMAVDQMGANCIHDSLPPFLNDSKRKGAVLNTVENAGLRWRGGGIVEGIEITGSMEIKLLRARAVRLVMEKEGIVLYHSLHNSRLYHEKDPIGIEISEDDAPGVEYLLHSYPNFVRVDTMPIEGGMENKIDLCLHLYRQGLLLIKDNNYS